MTTIAYYNGKLYADTRAYSGDKIPVGRKDKIHRLEEGIFAGTSTNVGASERVLQILKEKGVACAMPDNLDVDAFFIQKIPNVAKPELNRIALWGYFGGPAWIQLDETDTHFLGSGAQYAYGANMFADTVSDAMIAACTLDLWSSAPVQEVSVWS